MGNKKLNKKLRISKPVTEKGIKTMSRREVLKNFLLAPFQSILFFNLIAGEKTGPNIISGPVSNPDKIFVPDPAGVTENVFKPNEPMGNAQGIFPGRVSWIWNPASTNPKCANTIIAPDTPDAKYDGWFMDRNTNQEIVDQMLIAGLCS